MKLWLTFFLYFICAVAPAFAYEQSVLARVTVYWRGEGSGERASWNGMRLRDGHCAVDPKKIPFGSKVLFSDSTCLAVDSGPAVISRKAARACARTVAQRSALVIDRFFESRPQALSWERNHPHFMTVRIVPPGHHATPEFLRPVAQAPLPAMTALRALSDFRAMFEPEWFASFAREPAPAADRHS